MGLASLNRTLTLLYRIFDSRRSTVPLVQTPPQKPDFIFTGIDQPFQRATPESQNIPSDLINELVQQLAESKSIHIQDLMILRNGKVICETAFGGQSLSVWKTTFSACKSVVSLAVGIALDEKRISLEDKVVDFFPDQVTPVNRLVHKNLTIRHLLTMTSAVLFSEADCMTRSDWVRGFLSSSVKGEPGKTFNYNSLNTYMLSAILCKVTGGSLCDYLNPRLFAPLGITNYYWETCPKGIEKGGWGLYILPEDLAKLGQLVLNRGVWIGRRIISEEYLDEACSSQMKPPEIYGDYDYGYQIWSGRSVRSFLFNGMFGQNMLGFPESGILVVAHAGTSTTFQQSGFFTLVNRYLSAPFDTPLNEDPEAYARLRATLQSLQPAPAQNPSLVNPPPKPRWWHRFTRSAPVQRSAQPPAPPKLPPQTLALSGKSFEAKEDSAASLGLFPMMMQVLQNRYTKGLLSIRFEREEDSFRVIYKEKGAEHILPLAFGPQGEPVPTLTRLDLQGEPYLASVSGRFSADEDGNMVLILRLDFIETPFTRFLKLYFTEEGLLLRQLENPGKGFILQYAEYVKEEIVRYPVIGPALNKLDPDFLRYKIDRIFTPEIYLAPQIPSLPAPQETAPAASPAVALEG